MFWWYDPTMHSSFRNAVFTSNGYNPPPQKNRPKTNKTTNLGLSIIIILLYKTVIPSCKEFCSRWLRSVSHANKYKQKATYESRTELASMVILNYIKQVVYPRQDKRNVISISSPPSWIKVPTKWIALCGVRVMEERKTVKNILSSRGEDDMLWSWKGPNENGEGREKGSLPAKQCRELRQTSARSETLQLKKEGAGKTFPSLSPPFSFSWEEETIAEVLTVRSRRPEPAAEGKEGGSSSNGARRPAGRGNREGQGWKRPLRAGSCAPPATWEARRCCSPSAGASCGERRGDLGSSAGQRITSKLRGWRSA